MAGKWVTVQIPVESQGGDMQSAWIDAGTAVAEYLNRHHITPDHVLSLGMKATGIDHRDHRIIAHFLVWKEQAASTPKKK